jgi:hypothetical protein
MNLRAAIAPITTALTWRLALVLMSGFVLFTVWTSSPAELQSIGGNAMAARPQQANAPASDAVTPSVTPSYAAIAEHPLFYPSRMPWVPPPPPQPEPVSTAPSPLTNYALVGVIVSGHTRSALIKPPGANKTITLEEGQELDGWTLQQITRDRLHFAAGSASYEMAFRKPSESAR